VDLRFLSAVVGQWLMLWTSEIPP